MSEVDATKTTDNEKGDGPFAEYVWMEHEEEVNRECEEEIWQEEFQQLELDEMLEEEEEIREGERLSKVVHPVANGNASETNGGETSYAEEKKGENPFEEYLWMEHEDEVNRQCEEEIWEEEFQQLELDEMLEEEEEIREGERLSKLAMNGCSLINGDVSKEVNRRGMAICEPQDHSAEPESGKDNQ
jgi:hypothetical protein